MRIVPKVPHMNSMMHFVQKRIGRAIASTYLSTVGSRVGIDYSILSRWILVNAAERTYHGMLSEKEDLLKFIRKYLYALKHGGEEKLLYQQI
jgi:hypothetical protein